MKARMDCQECGANVEIQERHTFLDCAIYVARHRALTDERYALELVAEVERLRGVVTDELKWHEPCQDGRRTQPVCRACSEINRGADERWACSAARRLVAALGGEDG